MLKQIADRIGPNRVRKVLGYRGYDSKPNFNYSEKRGIAPTIRPRMTANPKKRTTIDEEKARQSDSQALLWEMGEEGKIRSQMGGRRLLLHVQTILRGTSKSHQPHWNAKDIIMKLYFYNNLITYKGVSTNR